MVLEEKLKKLEEECKQKETERVNLELELTEVKESLKKALAGGITLGLAIEPRSGTSSPQVQSTRSPGEGPGMLSQVATHPCAPASASPRHSSRARPKHVPWLCFKVMDPEFFLLCLTELFFKGGGNPKLFSSLWQHLSTILGWSGFFCVTSCLWVPIAALGVWGDPTFWGPPFLSRVSHSAPSCQLSFPVPYLGSAPLSGGPLLGPQSCHLPACGSLPCPHPDHSLGTVAAMRRTCPGGGHGLPPSEPSSASQGVDGAAPSSPPHPSARVAFEGISK